MILLRKPGSAIIQQFVRVQASLDFTYVGVGSTAAQPPVGYTVDHTRIRLGAGKHAFEAGKSVLKCWGHFQLGWVEALPRDVPIQVGQTVAVTARSLGVW